MLMFLIIIVWVLTFDCVFCLNGFPRYLSGVEGSLFSHWDGRFGYTFASH